MRQQTLQEQYNLIVEGKGSTHAFHKQALKQFPHLFTAQSSFDQVITVLKQKSIISEMVAQGLVSNSSGPNFFEIFNTNMAKLNEEAKAELKKADEEVVRAEKKTAKDKTDKYLNNQNGAEFLLGFYVESKKTKYVDKTVDQIKDIVVKNLSKDPLHYVKSGQFGLEELGYKEDVPGLGPTKEVKGKYASSGMEPVKLSESKTKSLKELHFPGVAKVGDEITIKNDTNLPKGYQHLKKGDVIKLTNLRKNAAGDVFDTDKGKGNYGLDRDDIKRISVESLKEGVDIYTVSAAALVQALENNPNFISNVKRGIAGDLAKRNTILKKLDDYDKNNPSDVDIKNKVMLTKKEILNAEPMREVKSKLVNEILKRIRTK